MLYSLRKINFLLTLDRNIHEDETANLIQRTFHESYHKNADRFVYPRTFNIERTTIFLFSFCIRFVTQPNGSSLGVLKHHYITKRIPELLIGNSSFLIHNSLNQLLYYTDIKDSCLLVNKIVE